MPEKLPIMRKLKLFTIGHSTRSQEEFLSLLGEFKIKVLIDIRRFPGSRRFPHFNRQSLEKTLPQAGIEYIWLENLGGRRSAEGETSPNGRSGPDIVNSLNTGLKHPAFRNYADYMQTELFHLVVNQLLSIASTKPTVVMCAEKLFWKCHRRLLCDYLVSHGCLIEHIIESGRLQPHELSAGAVITSDLRVIYPSARPDFDEPKLFD